MKLLKFSFLFLLIITISCDSSSDEQEPSATASINDLTISEGSSVVLDVTLSEVLSEIVILSYQTKDGSATAEEDYTPVNAQLIFEPGETRKNITVSISDDEEPEEEEIFYVDLTLDTDNITLNEEFSTITITDDDAGRSGELVIPTTGATSPEAYDGMTLVWQDEFESDAVNENDWTFEIGTGSNGWGNNELQYYRKENASIVEGNLVITAKRENFGGRSFTSTRMITKDKQEFLYGRIDIRAALPFGQGIWPALWMLGENIDQVGWPACGEIDIMELIGGGDGRDDRVHGTVHWSSGGNYAKFGGSYDLSEGIFNDEFHVFSIIWEENRIRWYVDDQLFHTIDTTPADLNEFRNEHFFIFNVAVGGNWPGNPNTQTVFSQYMIVDYIRVFQPN